MNSKEKTTESTIFKESMCKREGSTQETENVLKTIRAEGNDLLSGKPPTYRCQTARVQNLRVALEEAGVVIDQYAIDYWYVPRSQYIDPNVTEKDRMPKECEFSRLTLRDMGFDTELVFAERDIFDDENYKRLADQGYALCHPDDAVPLAQDAAHTALGSDSYFLATKPIEGEFVGASLNPYRWGIYHCSRGKDGQCKMAIDTFGRNPRCYSLDTSFIVRRVNTKRN